MSLFHNLYLRGQSSIVCSIECKQRADHHIPAAPTHPVARMLLAARSRAAARPRALLAALQPSLLAALQQQEQHAVQEQGARAIHSTGALPTLFFDVVGASPSGGATVATRPTTLCVLHGLLGVGRCVG